MSIADSRLEEIVAELAKRPGHEKVRTLVCRLLEDGLGADLHAIGHEVRVVEARGRIDALLGRTVVEFKSDLRRERRDAVEELSRYLPERERATGETFIGVVTDGADWEAYELRDGAPFRLRAYRSDPQRSMELLIWLDGAVATRSEIPPDALNIRDELGQDSVAYLRAVNALRAAWTEVKDHPTASLQRQLWSQLLTLVYGREIEDDELWFQHTFLVIVAKTIAARIMGVEAQEPSEVLSGRAFMAAGVFGAVESDFFDWILLAPGGPELVDKLAKHVGRFRLRDVSIDVMKLIYESLIDRDQRHGLGEYYTPDWLAKKVIDHVVTAPLEQTVLDPACGSGTFLFHAVRKVLAEAHDAGLEPDLSAGEACRLVAGMDIHPVAVIIARVTFLMALSPVLARRGGEISIPVYLGDSMQLRVRSYMRETELTITVPPPPGEPASAIANGGATGGALVSGAATLTFPERLAKDGPLFDKLIENIRVSSLADETQDQFRRAGQRTIEQHYKADMSTAQATALDDLAATYLTYHALRKAGRDSIWGYVARNLTRPFALASAVRRTSILVGNPPWVAFRHMSGDLQKRFKELAQAERIYAGGKLATQNDLAALFTVRAAGLYLNAAGRIAFVLPRAALTRGQFSAFRSGSFDSVRIAWDEAWDLEGVEPLFPVPACVLFGRRRATAKPVPSHVTAFSGRLPIRDASEPTADDRLRLVQSEAPSEASEHHGSPYRTLFVDGATLYPRMLVLAAHKAQGRLGMSASRPLMESRRSNLEKAPWKDLAGIEHSVEASFIRRIFLGESILPYRAERPVTGVIPMDGNQLLDSTAAADRGWSGLAGWMRAVEAAWNANSEAGVRFVDQIDYYGKLTSQFPIAPLRVVYAKAGNNPAACLLRDIEALVDHKLYWATPESEDEGYYLVAVINSEAARRRVERLQSRGLFGARDFDKVMFTLPIPRFDVRQSTHAGLAKAGRDAEALAAQVATTENEPFTRARKRVRDALKQAGLADQIDALVDQLLG